MKFWTPVVSKRQPKQYKTLADVPEGVACIVAYGDTEWLVRQRKGEDAYRVESSIPKDRTGDAYRYTFVRALGPLPEPRITIKDLPDGRCFQVNSVPGTIFWKHGTYILSQASDGTFGTSLTVYRNHPDSILDIEMQLQDFPVTQSN